MMHHCPKCDSTNVIMGLDVLCCHECNWMSRKMIMGRTGPQLDVLIATTVMDWIERNPRTSAAYWALDTPMNPQIANLDWSPSTDINTTMGDVVRGMKNRGYQLELRTYADTKVDQPGVTTGCRFLTHDEALKTWTLTHKWFPGDDEAAGHADSIPLAICRAALLAVNVIPVDKTELQSTGT